MGRLAAVCRTYAVKPDLGYGHPDGTGIDKRPVDTIRLTPTGVVGDKVLDTENHGGRDKAAYAYAREDAAWWAAELRRDLPPGSFGENLATEGVDLTGAIIGERWRIGRGPEAVLVEVVSPRIPCRTFQAHVGEPHWVKRFTAHGASGAYLRVLREGTVHADDPVELLDRPVHGVTVGEAFAMGELPPARLRRLLDHPDLADALRDRVERRLRGAATSRAD